MQKYYVEVYSTHDEWFNPGTYWHSEAFTTLHRLDGPAVERADGHKEWWLCGIPHREDGPAVVYANGDKVWWLNGILMMEEEHARRTQPAQEMTVAEIEKLLGKRIKIVKEQQWSNCWLR